MMNSDFCFRMGSTHAICQDYAMAGVRLDGLAYAIVSDGCSGSPIAGEPGSPYTDFGARLLARSAASSLSALANGKFPDELIINEAKVMARSLALPSVALDATLLAAATFGETVWVALTGDGVLAARRRTGEIDYWTTAFDQNMPLYLSHMVDSRRFDDWKRASGGYVWTMGTVGQGRSSVRVDLLEESFTRLLPFNPENYDIVLLFSDGAESFQLRDGTPVELERVLEQVFAIKGFAGQFLGRRCGRFLGSFCAEAGWKHVDDFSVAGIYLGGAP